jgi:hypothetical protein
MQVVQQPFFIFYASRLKEVVQISVTGAPDGAPVLNVLHHESKAALVASTPSSRFKERILQLTWRYDGSMGEQSLNFSLPLCAYGNEALRLSFQWPNGEVRIIHDNKV